MEMDIAISRDSSALKKKVLMIKAVRGIRASNARFLTFIAFFLTMRLSSFFMFVESCLVIRLSEAQGR